MKRYITLTVLVLLAASCGGRRGQDGADGAAADSLATAVADKPAPKAETKVDSVAQSKNVLPQEPIFDIVTNMGTIRVKLYKDTPKHRNNFIRLARTHFYENLLFHRVVNGFVIQGGDPYTRDTSASTNGARAARATPSTRKSSRSTSTRSAPWPPPAAATWPTR